MLVTAAAAVAGSDLFSNVGPESQVGQGGLAGRYPLSHYALDQHFTAVEASLTGGVDVSGVPAQIAYFLANLLWQLTAFVANAVITLFTFAFSLDLVQGSEATGGAGALAPVSDAVRTIYQGVFGAAWLVVAITLAGIWAMWRALVQRRYTETAGALGLSLVFVVIALAFVTQPERTIGTAADWTNRMSAAFLSLTAEGEIASEAQAKQAASDQLFELLVYDPWVVLNFGGIEHCTKPGTGSDDADPESVAVRPLAHDPARDRRLRTQLRTGSEVQAEGKTCVNNRTKYAPHFLAFAPGSEERNAEYEALNDGDTGKLPDADPAKDGGYTLGAVDKPASDAMEEGGQYQRLLMAVVIFTGELGAFLLLGALSVAVVLAQVLVLLLLTFAPVALVVGVLPGRGHDFFRGWLTRLAAFLLRKAIYSLILAVLLAVAAAVADASAYLGWLMAFGLQALFFWAVFLYRKELTGALTTATTGAPRHEGADPAHRLSSLYYATQLAQLRRHRHRNPPPPRQGHPGPPPPPSSPPSPGGNGPATRDHDAAPPRVESDRAGRQPASEEPPTHRREKTAPARGPEGPGAVTADREPSGSPSPPAAPPGSQADDASARPTGARRPDPASAPEPEGRHAATQSEPERDSASGVDMGDHPSHSPVAQSLRADQRRLHADKPQPPTAQAPDRPPGERS